jgi:hypothetical protein
MICASGRILRQGFRNSASGLQRFRIVGLRLGFKVNLGSRSSRLASEFWVRVRLGLG